MDSSARKIEHTPDRTPTALHHPGKLQLPGRQGRASIARLARLPVPASVLLLLVLLTGCTIFPLGGSPTGQPGGGPSAFGRGLKDYRVIFHCHSLLSHDSRGTFAAIAASARSIGINGILLTDHYKAGNIAASPGRGREPEFFDGVLFIPGAELRGPDKQGSILPIGIPADFEKGRPITELAREFRRAGAPVIAGHCEEIRDWGLVEIDGLEIYNLHAEFKGKSAWSILWRFLFLPVDCFFESSVTFPRLNLDAWDRLLNSGARVTPLVASDAHANVRLFGFLGGTIGTYPEIFRLFSNHIQAVELRPEAILDAIRRGRVYCVFDFLGDATGFSFSCGNPRTAATVESRAILGDTQRFDPQADLQVEVPVEARIRILRNGETCCEVTGRRVAAALPGPGIYRTEVYLDGRLWIASGWINVEG